MKNSISYSDNDKKGMTELEALLENNADTFPIHLELNFDASLF